MPTIVDCPSCTRKLRVAEDLLGQRVKCPTCGGTFNARGPSGAAPPDMEPPTAPEAPPPGPAASTPPPLPTPAPAETVPIQLSLDEYDKPARPPGFKPVAPDAPSRPRKREEPSRGRREFMRCPYCDERISADSRRCRYCGEDVDDADEFDIRKRPGVRRDCEPHRGTLILVLGIISIVIHALGLPLGLPAWIMGRRDLTKMDRGEMDPAGRGATQAGYICGIIGTILGSLTVLFCVGYIGLFAMVAATAPTTTKPPPGQQQPWPPQNNPPPGRMK